MDLMLNPDLAERFGVIRAECQGKGILTIF